MVKQLITAALLLVGLATSAQAQVDLRVTLPIPGGGFVSVGTPQQYYPVYQEPVYAPVYTQPVYTPVYTQPVYSQPCYPRQQVQYQQVRQYQQVQYSQPVYNNCAPRYNGHHRDNYRHGRRCN